MINFITCSCGYWG